MTTQRSFCSGVTHWSLIDHYTYQAWDQSTFYSYSLIENRFVHEVLVTSKVPVLVKI